MPQTLTMHMNVVPDRPTGGGVPSEIVATSRSSMVSRSPHPAHQCPRGTGEPSNAKDIRRETWPRRLVAAQAGSHARDFRTV